MDLGFDVVVTITGIVLVFLILVLLMTIITLEGKIFDAISVKKNPPKAPKAASASKAAAPAPKPAASKAEAPVQAAAPAGGIPGEKVGCVVHPNMDLLKEMNNGAEMPWAEIVKVAQSHVHAQCQHLADYKRVRKVVVSKEPLERTSIQKVRRVAYKGKLDE